VRAEYRIRIFGTSAHLEVSFCIFYQWIKIRLERHLEIFQLISPHRRRKMGFPFSLDHISMSGFSVRGALGLKDEALWVILSVGFLRIFFENLKCFMDAREGAVEINPLFDRNSFWLNMEGIIRFRTVKIITDLIFRYKRGGRRRKKDAPSY